MENYQNEGVNHPKHYRHTSGLDAIAWIDRYHMDFSLGSCFKYLFRAGLKDGESKEKDLEKAKWYFKHEVEKFYETGVKGSWQEAKDKVFEILSNAFGNPGKAQDQYGDFYLDWSKGGCDMPEAIEFLKEQCMNCMRD